MSNHIPVLLHEAIEALAIRPDGVYVDATYGRGGHSQAILQKLVHMRDDLSSEKTAKGKLIVFDQDPEAIAHANEIARHHYQMLAIHANFSLLSDWLIANNIQIDGALFDLGVSSAQLDNPRRGFSFQHDDVLDMRMNNRTGATAGDWLQSVQVDELAHVLRHFGEERFAQRIARAICRVRPSTTLSLAKVVADAQGKWDAHKHPATRTFQAIRMFINNEIESLEQALCGLRKVMRTKARLVVISFHSLEDRLVKRFLQSNSGLRHPPSVPTMDWQTPPVLKVLKKVIASKQERQFNPRSRSAVMRVAEFVGQST